MKTLTAKVGVEVVNHHMLSGDQTLTENEGGAAISLSKDVIADLETLANCYVRLIHGQHVSKMMITYSPEASDLCVT